ncbi:MAG: hypothetical protein IJX78_07400 [Bacilli bacterium]|nr:hypothetical protein [Bacilli bacterium]
MKKLSLFFILIFYLVFTISFPYIIRDNLINTCILFVTTVMPSILPMYLISSFLSNTNFISRTLYPLFKRIMHFENSSSFSIYLLSILVGNPTSTILINQAIEKNNISIKEAKRLSNFTFFMNPLFIINTCQNYSFLIIAGSIISSIVIGYFLKNKDSSDENKNNSTSFFEIINHAPSMLLNILIMMLVISLLKSPTQVFFFPWQIGFLWDLLEVSLGVTNVVNYQISDLLKLVLLTILINSNGLCIILQIKSISKFLSFKDLINKKIVVILITTIITLFLYFVFYR